MINLGFSNKVNYSLRSNKGKPGYNSDVNYQIKVFGEITDRSTLENTLNTH
jgi:hypothetical protein